MRRRHVHPQRDRPARLHADRLDCTNGGGGAFDAGSVTIETGDAPVTCSITNDDEPVQLTIVKTVINDDGGTATVDDFAITTDAGELVFSAADDGTTTIVYTSETLTVPAGTYTLARPTCPATRRPPGRAPTAAAAPSTRARSRSRPATPR